jgi:aryl-alcohol dehydrogenase-like predicted oxidoreductase
MIFGGRVCSPSLISPYLTYTIRLPLSLWKTELTCSVIVPKFQGENFYANKAIVEQIKTLASRKGCTISQIALAWVAAQGLIAIPGTTKVHRLEENFASREVELTEEELGEMRRIVDSAKPQGNRYAAAQQALVGH